MYIQDIDREQTADSVICIHHIYIDYIQCNLDTSDYKLNLKCNIYAQKEFTLQILYIVREQQKSSGYTRHRHKMEKNL